MLQVVIRCLGAAVAAVVRTRRGRVCELRQTVEAVAPLAERDAGPHARPRAGLLRRGQLALVAVRAERFVWCDFQSAAQGPALLGVDSHQSSLKNQKCSVLELVGWWRPKFLEGVGIDWVPPSSK